MLCKTRSSKILLDRLDLSIIYKYVAFPVIVANYVDDLII